MTPYSTVRDGKLTAWLHTCVVCHALGNDGAYPDLVLAFRNPKGEGKLFTCVDQIMKVNFFTCVDQIMKVNFFTCVDQIQNRRFLSSPSLSLVMNESPHSMYAKEYRCALQVSQCCRDHVAAASAGHVHCLQHMQQRGHFLGLDSPERAWAGEARRMQEWEAANVACEAGHARVVSWLFSSGWPAEEGVKFPWHLRDGVKPELWEAGNLRRLGSISWAFLPELQLFRSALRNSGPDCLVALLDAGCCSGWICKLAALEGRADFWALALERGCPFDISHLIVAAWVGNLPCLELVYGIADKSLPKKDGRGLYLEVDVPFKASAMVEAHCGGMF
jgi:hypothetical protein